MQLPPNQPSLMHWVFLKTDPAEGILYNFFAFLY